MNQQLDLFEGTTHSREYLEWLRSPPDTPAPPSVRERGHEKKPGEKR